MAENTRLGRQLADLLGDAAVTNVRVQLGSRSDPAAASRAPTDFALLRAHSPSSAAMTGAPPLADAALLAEAATALGAPMASPSRRPVTPSKTETSVIGPEAEGTAPAPEGRSAPASAPVRPPVTPLSSAPVLPDTPLPERTLHASMAPSLPADRQELPAEERLTTATGAPVPETRRARVAEASNAVPASSALDASGMPVVGRSERPEEVTGSREARNLPSDGSTDAKAAGSADRVTLQVSDEDGRQTRIRVTVTGNQVRAVITPPDDISARQLEQRMDQLTETLVRQGYADPKVMVRTATDAMNEARAAVQAGTGAQDGRTAGPASREQPAGDNRQGRGQREQHRSGDGHRHPQGQPRDRDPRDRRR